jgi:hypothetical protein
MFINFKWDGSYNKVHDFLQNLPRSYERERAKEMKHFGIATMVELQQRIAAGQTEPELSDKYLKWKQKHGLMVGRLVRTRHYYYLLKLEHTDTGFTINPSGKEHPIERNGKLLNPKPKSYEDIATWLEYGTKRTPARPHWRPVSASARAKFPGVMRKVIEAAFQRARQGGYGGSPRGYSTDVRDNPWGNDSPWER